MVRLARLGICAAVIAALVGGCGGSPSANPGGATGKQATSSSALSSSSAPSLTAPSTPVLSYVDDAVGFSENLDTTYGTHRVLTVHDPAENTVLNVPPGMHAVRVPIEECVRTDHASVRVTAAGWTMATSHPAEKTGPALGLQPAVDGSHRSAVPVAWARGDA
jgi:hypothetical protein